MVGGGRVWKGKVVEERRGREELRWKKRGEGVKGKGLKERGGKSPECGGEGDGRGREKEDRRWREGQNEGR